MSIANTSSGDAILWMDASNGDLSGADYASIRQNNGLDLLRTEASASEIIFQPAGSTALTLNTDRAQPSQVVLPLETLRQLQALFHRC